MMNVRSGNDAGCQTRRRGVAAQHALADKRHVTEYEAHGAYHQYDSRVGTVTCKRSLTGVHVHLKSCSTQQDLCQQNRTHAIARRPAQQQRCTHACSVVAMYAVSRNAACRGERLLAANPTDITWLYITHVCERGRVRVRVRSLMTVFLDV